MENEKIYPVEWEGKHDNNDGYIYGIEWYDHNDNFIDIQWFRTKEERDKELKEMKKGDE